MKSIRRWGVGSVVGAALVLAGCGKKESQSPAPSASSTQQAPQAAAPAAQEPSGSFNPATVFDSGGVNFNSVDSLLQQGQYEQAVLSVMTAQRSGKGSTDDSLKLQRKMQDIQSDVARRAASGDQRAIQAMKLLRQTAPSGR